MNKTEHKRIEYKSGDIQVTLYVDDNGVHITHFGSGAGTYFDDIEQVKELIAMLVEVVKDYEQSKSEN